MARKIAEEMDEGVIVTILADAGWKYMSADFWEASDEDLERVHGTHDLVVVPAAVRAALVAHANAELPNEACGLVLFEDDDGGRVRPRHERLRRRRTTSSCRSTRSTWADLNDRDVVQAVFHSHVSSPPRPSRTDVQNIGLWAGQPYLIYTVRTDELAALAHRRRRDPACTAHFRRLSLAAAVGSSRDEAIGLAPQRRPNATT